MAENKILFGTAGWSYADWEGIVYDRKEGGLAAISMFMDCVEVNASFYRIPAPSMAEGWLRKTEHNSDFIFLLKLWQGFTHKDSFSEHDARAFQDVSRVLSGAGRLGGVLAQFPFFFDCNHAHAERVRRLADTFGETGLFCEFRHASWLTDEVREDLHQRGVGWCNIDIPGGEKDFNQSAEMIGDRAYLRLHGRNRKAWFSKDAGRDAKYNYLYSPAEIEKLVRRIETMTHHAGKGFVVANNHYRGKAVANTMQLKAAITGEKPAIPASLAREYPDLADFPGDRDGLFD